MFFCQLDKRFLFNKIVIRKNSSRNLVVATFKLRCYTQALSLATTSIYKKKIFLTVPAATKGEINEKNNRDDRYRYH